MPKELVSIYPIQEIELGQAQLNSLIDPQEQYEGTIVKMLIFTTGLFEKKTPLRIVHVDWSNPGEQMFRLTDATNFPHGGYFDSNHINRFFDVLWPGKEDGAQNYNKRIAKASLSLRGEVLLKPQA